mmetsp:Transcript_116277/g.249892  ORF Transcript_116277/g.249892 Transcript_116277/m.249892 type:complete len:88 (-) Transcript_116277:345-608(-)
MIKINLKAEAFKVVYDIIYQNENKFLDFGPVRVGEKNHKMLRLVNNGLYDITFEFEKLNKLARKIFTISPEKGQIAPSQEQEILVTF